MMMAVELNFDVVNLTEDEARDWEVFISGLPKGEFVGRAIGSSIFCYKEQRDEKEYRIRITAITSEDGTVWHCIETFEISDSTYPYHNKVFELISEPNNDFKEKIAHYYANELRIRGLAE
jgi:hypothetical protein